jgi:hypothetical protein
LSFIRVDNFGPSAGGTIYSARGIAKAWVNFNGTGTIAARDSENVSSLTDFGTGYYAVSFSSAMLAADYAHNSSAGQSGVRLIADIVADSVVITSSFNVATSVTGTLTDGELVTASIHGDLA